MDLHHLKTFVVVADERSFTKAAARLSISQPPLSRHVRDLEAQLGLRLLTRDHQKVELTAQGAALLSKAKIVLDSFNDFVAAAERLRLEADATVTVGLSPALWGVIATVQAAPKGRHPDLRLAVKELRTQPWPDFLLEGRVDVGIVHGSVDDVPECHSHKLYDEEVIVLLPATHRLADAAAVKLSDLRNEAVITTKGFVQAPHLNVCRKAGFAPSRIVEIPINGDRGSFRFLITSGRGIFFFGASPWTTRIDVQGMSAVRVDEPYASCPVTIVWRRNETSRAVLDFVNTTIDVFQNIGAYAHPLKLQQKRTMLDRS
jgi:DNA-binding transcriptional LysR family regulator